MTITESTVTLDSMRVFAHHGVLEQERRIGNDFAVSVTVRYDAGRAIAGDNVGDAVDYSHIAEIIRREMAIPSNLLEHVAGRIAAAIIDEIAAITGGSVTVKKIHPPMPVQADGAAVTVSFIR